MRDRASRPRPPCFPGSPSPFIIRTAPSAVPGGITTENSRTLPPGTASPPGPSGTWIVFVVPNAASSQRDHASPSTSVTSYRMVTRIDVFQSSVPTARR